MKYLFTTALFFLFINKATSQDLVQSVDSIRKSSGIPEIGFAILTSARILEAHTIGFHRHGITDPSTKAQLTDYFHLGSNTKAITAFIAAHLVENKKIQWDTKFFSLFPEWKEASNPVYFNMTLAELLSHRAWIKPYTSGEEFQRLPKFSGLKSEQRRQFVEYLVKHDALEKNNETYNYSNAGYSIAALMLEKASGKNWEQLVDDVLSVQLKLKYKFSWPNRTDLNQPWGHWLEGDSLVALPSGTAYNLNLAEPAGDISMPLPDYARWVQMNLAGLTGKDNFLKAATYSYLHYGFDKYALGWLNVNETGKNSSEHAGSAGTFYCYTLINKDKNLAYIVTANSATEKALEGIFKLLELMIRKTESK